MAPAPTRYLWPNVGAEEGDPAKVAHLPAVDATRRLWGGLFDRTTEWLSPDFAPDAETTTALHETPVSKEIASLEGVVPWLADAAAHRVAAAAGLPLCGAPAEVVAQVHDKAFAVRHAFEERLGARALREAARVFEPAELRDAERFVAAVRETLDAWPPALQAGGYVVKPRLGTSGRGQLMAPAHLEGVESPTTAPIGRRRLAKAAPRLAERGGAILEPWLKRTLDLSVSAMVFDPAGRRNVHRIHIVASLRQLIAHHGFWLGHIGEVDARGRIYSGTRFDDDMWATAASVAEEAERLGYLGPCGIDGLAYEDPEEPGREALRPLVEVNARFTMGHVCAGWVRRALPWLKTTLDLAPGRRLPFLFVLRAPRGADGWRDVAAVTGSHVLPLPFATPYAGPLELAEQDVPGDSPTNLGPALVFDEDLEALELIAARL